VAAKTPIIIVSSTSSSAKNMPAERGLSGADPAGSTSFQDARITIGISAAASTISTSAMPSTPTAYRTPNCGIHS
jgi:hypothetical protein